MLKKIALGVVVAIVGVLGYAATKPDTFRLERSIVINAPADQIHAHIDDFHAWRDWSPFEKLDADLKRDYGGAKAGVGATYGWDGKNAGAGTMEIKESEPGKRVAIALHFTKPMEGDDTAEFTLTPEGSGTKVTWAMYGPAPYIHKLMTCAVSMDSMMGPTFDEGLEKLKAVSEKQTKK